jgi:hypothetical protein
MLQYVRLSSALTFSSRILLAVLVQLCSSTQTRSRHLFVVWCVCVVCVCGLGSECGSGEGGSVCVSIWGREAASVRAWHDIPVCLCVR